MPLDRSCVNVDEIAGLACVLCLLLGLASPAIAQAQPDPFEALDPQQAQTLLSLLDQAERAEHEGRWADAIGLYEQMRDILDVEEYRYREAFCHEQRGDYVEALALYRSLADSPRRAIANTARGRVNVLETLVQGLPARLRIATNRLGAHVLLNDEELGRTAEGDVVFEVPAGEHHLTVRLEGFRTVERAVTLEPGQEQQITVMLEESRRQGTEHEALRNVSELAAATDEGEVVARRAERRNWTLPAILGGSAVAALGVGIGFGVAADNRAEEFRDYDKWAEGASRRAWNDMAQDTNRLATASNVSFAVSAALAAGAIVAFFVTSPGDETDPSGVTVMPLVYPSAGLGASLTWWSR